MLSDKASSAPPNSSLRSAKKILVPLFLGMLVLFMPHIARADYPTPLFWIKFTTFSGCRLEPHPNLPPGFIPGPWASYPTCLELGMDVAGVRCSYSGEIISLPGGGSITCYGRYACGLEAVTIRQTADGYICITQDYVVRLSPVSGQAESDTTLTSIEPDMLTTLVARVYNQSNQLVPNVGVQLVLDAKQDSGGHHHGDNTVVARTGTLAGQQVLSGNTGPTGLQFSYQAPSVSGDYKIKAACTDGKNCKPEGPDTVWVGYKRLQPVGDNVVYRLIPNAAKDPGHPDNHYLTFTAASRLTVLATLYRAKYPEVSVLHLNDASLERGGIFDLNHNWKSPHFEHCRGTVIDIRANGAGEALNITSDNDPMIEKLKEIGRIAGVEPDFEIPKDKEGNRLWNLRHFHTYLMGQEGLQCP